MSETYRITIFENGRTVYENEYSGPVELGRQQRSDGEMFRSHLSEGCIRIPVARRDEADVARKQLLIEPLNEGMVRLTNQSSITYVPLLGEPNPLLPSASIEAVLPVTLRIGTREIVIDQDHSLRSLAEAPQPPGVVKRDVSILGTIGAEHANLDQSMISWLQAAMEILQGTANSLNSFERAAEALVDMIDLDAGRVLMIENGEWVVKAAAVSERIAERGDDQRGWQPSSQVLSGLLREKRTFWKDPPVNSASVAGLQAIVAAPILDPRGEVIGAMYGDRTGDDEKVALLWRPISRLEATLVQLLAGAVAAGLAHTKLVQIERELAVGRQIQAGFLPATLPQADGWEIASHFRPAREVSGDFYDAFALPGGLLAVVVADVCDKGVGSALYMTLFRSLLRAFAQEESVRMAKVPTQASCEIICHTAVSRTNDYVVTTHGWQCMFCTLFFGVLHPTTNRLSYINAGHDAPVVISASQGVRRLTRTGPAVGFRSDAEFGVCEVAFDPGEVLFAYTDGVTEARNSEGKFFKEEGLLSVLENGRTAAGLIAAVVERIQVHSGGTEPHDDVTILALRRNP